MASVRKREWLNPRGEPQVAYVVTYKDQNGVRRTPQFPKKHMANDFRLKVERELFDGIHMPSSVATKFSELAARYLRDCDRRRRLKDRMSGNTFDLARRLTDTHLVPAFGGTKVSDITGRQVREFVNLKAETYSRVTVMKLVKHLRDMLHFGMQEGCNRRNVVRDEPPRIPVPPRGQIEIPSLVDLRRLFDVLESMLASDTQRLPGAYRRQRGDGPLFMAITVYAALTGGLRRGEIAALRWENVVFERGMIKIRHSLSRFDGLKEPKSKAGIRDVPLHPLLSGYLSTLWTKRGRPSEGYVLITGRDKPVAPDDVSRLYWEPVARAADMKRKDGSLMGMHSLRHAAASLWIKAGVPDLSIKKAIGHSSISTTKDVYGHLFADDGEGHRAMVDSVAVITSKRPVLKFEEAARSSI